MENFLMNKYSTDIQFIQVKLHQCKERKFFVETIQQKLKTIETTELLKELSYGKEAFQEDIYELYMQEAINRGIVDEIFFAELQK